jgi:uncharacterized protein YdaU (DUF1376 family)
MNYYPHHIGDFRSGTFNMSRQKRWIYRDMIDVYYDTESSFPNDMDKICEMVGVESDSDRALVISILSMKFILIDNEWANERCNRELASYKSKAETAQNNGKKGGRPPKLAENKPSGLSIGSNQLFHRNPEITGSQANQEPITINQEIKTNTLVSGDAADLIQIASTSKLTCPHQSIIDLYHAELPVCPRIKDWTPARQTHLRARWNEDAERQDLDYWQRLFGYIATCDFLVGKGGGTRPFFAGLEWIVKSENFAKIREGKYENRVDA